MKITLVCKQVSVDEDLKNLVEKKLSKFDKFFYKEGEATVKFSRKNNQKTLEITINAANTLFRSEVEDESFQNALDRSVEKIVGQIRKNKTRLAKRLRTGVFDETGIDDGAVAEEGNNLIRIKNFRLKPMSADEAILQMNLLGHRFFVFEDQDTFKICVVYKRDDGAYGLIVPEK